MENQTSGSISSGKPFNGLKVFSATMVEPRSKLGDVVTEFLAVKRAAGCEITDIVITQSSDEAFHCIAITVFYMEPQPKVTKRADGAYTAGPPPDGRPVAEHLEEIKAKPNRRLKFNG